MRRTIGPAHEKAPAERAFRWFSENTMRLLSAVLCFGLFWFLTNGVVRILNFVMSSGTEDVIPQVIKTDSGPVVGVKIVGGIVLFILVVIKRK